MSEDFLIEHEDSGKSAEIALVADLIERYASLIRAKSYSNNYKDILKKASKVLQKASTEKDAENYLKHNIILLEASIAKNELEKDVYYQLKRAEHLITTLGNERSVQNSFSKKGAMDKEKIALIAMRQKLKLQDLCDYMNNRYKKQLKESSLAPFVLRDMSTYLKLNS